MSLDFLKVYHKYIISTQQSYKMRFSSAVHGGATHFDVGFLNYIFWRVILIFLDHFLNIKDFDNNFFPITTNCLRLKTQTRYSDTVRRVFPRFGLQRNRQWRTWITSKRELRSVDDLPNFRSLVYLHPSTWGQKCEVHP